MFACGQSKPKYSALQLRVSVNPNKYQYVCSPRLTSITEPAHCGFDRYVKKLVISDKPEFIRPFFEVVVKQITMLIN